jgi:S-DNA-T family DNA segregation ATPase FtsK/SpoIIIE
MAQGSGKKTVKKSGGRRSAPAAKKASGAHSASAAPKKPVRREVTGAVLAFLGLLSFIAYFGVDAIFISGLRKLIGGLVGWGFYIFPPVMFIAAYIMLAHHGRPVAFRLTSALLLPVLFGAMTHLLFSQAEPGSAGGFAAMVSLLYSDGTQLAFGGVISGLLSCGLEKALSVYGAFPLLLAAFIYFTLSMFNLSISKIVAWSRSRERAEYEPEPMPDPEPEQVPVRGRGAAAAEPRFETLANPRRGIDIPLDDEPEEEPQNGKRGLFVKPKAKPAESVQKGDKTPITPANQPSPTAAVKPAAIEEAAALAGVPVSLAGDGKTASGEISDPPKPKMTKDEVASQAAAVGGEIAAKTDSQEYRYPDVELLRKSPAGSVDGREEIAMNRERLENTMTSFGVSAKVADITRGPTVTRYDFELDQGVKLSRLTNLSDDIALALGAVSVRIAPIPDKISTVGIEVPNKLVSPVYLRDIIDTPKFKNAPSKLSFALGKNISGDGIVGNIAKLPHLLIAGTTGSGKSVCMNSLIISLLYKARPEEVKLIMIDPKMVELGVYNGIPHLYIPVVTDPKKAAGALQWAVVEMLKRYRLFSDDSVRDISSYNEHRKAAGEDILPRVVIVIDELADLMMAASKEVEESICRVAQMGRAAGMHLVIATQRPSADVITGLMKANIPSRIAFAVSSAMESRIILDQSGAEKLIGLGDMLFAPLGSGKPIRIQGAFVSDEEREDVINFVKQQGQADYSDEIMASIEKAAEEKNSKSDSDGDEPQSGPGGDYDELLPQAVDVIFDTKQASVSMLQRRLKLGYSRAARLVDQMEEMGIVGPFEGSKPRQVLITKEQWQEMQMVQGTAPTEIMETRMEFGEDEPPEEDDNI